MYFSLVVEIALFLTTGIVVSAFGKYIIFTPGVFVKNLVKTAKVWHNTKSKKFIYLLLANNHLCF